MPPAPRPERGTLRLAAVLAVLIGVNLYVFLWRGDTSIPAVMEQAAMAGRKDGADREAVAGQPDEAPARAGQAPARAEAGQGDDDDADAPGPAPGQPVPETAEDEDRWVKGEVQPGDSMGRLLRRENMSPPEIDEVIRALSDQMDFRKIRPGQAYRLRFDSAGKLMEFEFHVSRTIKVRAVRDASGRLVGKKTEARTELRIHEVGGRIESSLYASVKGSGEDTSLVSFFVDIFAYDLDFYVDTHPGDTFRLVVEKEYVGDDFLRYGRVLAAEYRGKAGAHRAFHWKAPGDGEGRYYDAEGRSLEKALLKTPLKFTRISSGFNPSRMHPILHKRRGHMGVDYAAPTGTPVWAAASGRIVFRGWRGAAGNCVILKHDGGLETVYMHLSSFRKGQEVGQHVQSKTVIGYVGSTGMSTGPHLHFEVKKDGRHVDPLKLEPTRRGSVSKQHRARFEADVRPLVQRLGRIEVPGAT